MAQKVQPILNTKAAPTVSASTPTIVSPAVSSAPVISLKSGNGQIAVYAEHAACYTAGEEAMYLVRMKDGTCCYKKESELSQAGGSVMI